MWRFWNVGVTTTCVVHFLLKHLKVTRIMSERHRKWCEHSAVSICTLFFCHWAIEAARLQNDHKLTFKALLLVRQFSNFPYLSLIRRTMQLFISNSTLSACLLGSLTECSVIAEVATRTEVSAAVEASAIPLNVKHSFLSQTYCDLSMLKVFSDCDWFVRAVRKSQSGYSTKIKGT